MTGDREEPSLDPPGLDPLRFRELLLLLLLSFTCGLVVGFALGEKS